MSSSFIAVEAVLMMVIPSTTNFLVIHAKSLFSSTDFFGLLVFC